jgi:hypothetical protein
MPPRVLRDEIEPLIEVDLPLPLTDMRILISDLGRPPVDRESSGIPPSAPTCAAGPRQESLADPLDRMAVGIGGVHSNLYAFRNGPKGPTRQERCRFFRVSRYLPPGSIKL